MLTANPSRRARPVAFKHLVTGRVIKAPSIAAFCRQAGLWGNAKYQFDAVLKGHRIHRLGWGLPKTLDKPIRLKDVFGNERTAALSDVTNRLGVISAKRLHNNRTVQNGIMPASRNLSGVLFAQPHQAGPLHTAARFSQSLGEHYPSTRHRERP